MKTITASILAATALLTAGCSTSRVMNEVMASWDGALLDAVVAQWGMPSRQIQLGDRTMYAWDKNTTAVTPVQTHSTATADYTTGYTQVNSYSTGGHVIHGDCTREVTVDASNTVVATGWRGNNCPFAEWLEYAEWRRKD